MVKARIAFMQEMGEDGYEMVARFIGAQNVVSASRLPMVYRTDGACVDINTDTGVLSFINTDGTVNELTPGDIVTPEQAQEYIKRFTDAGIRLDKIMDTYRERKDNWAGQIMEVEINPKPVEMPGRFTRLIRFLFGTGA